MSALVWSEDLMLSMPELDTIHQEFVALLAQAQTASDADLVPIWQTLVAHTEAHFALEDRWMVASGFPADNCHSRQHAVVLQVLREGAQQGSQGHVAPIRQMAHELSIWFPHHAQTMDAALTQHLQARGFDPRMDVQLAPCDAGSPQAA